MNIITLLTLNLLVLLTILAINATALKHVNTSLNINELSQLDEYINKLITEVLDSDKLTDSLSVLILQYRSAKHVSTFEKLALRAELESFLVNNEEKDEQG